MIQRMFGVAVLLGALIGAATGAVLMLPSLSTDWESLVLLAVGVGAFAGAIFGLLCCVAAYVAVGILISQRPGSSVRSRSVVAGLGSMVAALLPLGVFFFLSSQLADSPKTLLTGLLGGGLLATAFGFAALVFYRLATNKITVEEADARWNS